jgi:hypothetical protein
MSVRERKRDKRKVYRETMVGMFNFVSFRVATTHGVL